MVESLGSGGGGLDPDAKAYSIGKWANYDSNGSSGNHDYEGTRVVALGMEAYATATGAVGIGSGCYATGKRSVALGGAGDYPDGANAGHDRAIAIGAGATTDYVDSTVLGTDAKAYDKQCVSIGSGAVTDYHNTVTIGYNAYSQQNHNVALGAHSDALGLHSTAIGARTSADGQYSIAIGGAYDTGNGAATAGGTAIAIGTKSTANHSSSIALGYDVQALDYGHIRIGGGNSDYKKVSFPMVGDSDLPASELANQEGSVTFDESNGEFVFHYTDTSGTLHKATIAASTV